MFRIVGSSSKSLSRDLVVWGQQWQTKWPLESWETSPYCPGSAAAWRFPTSMLSKEIFIRLWNASVLGFGVEGNKCTCHPATVHATTAISLVLLLLLLLLLPLLLFLLRLVLLLLLSLPNFRCVIFAFYRSCVFFLFRLLFLLLLSFDFIFSTGLVSPFWIQALTSVTSSGWTKSAHFWLVWRFKSACITSFNCTHTKYSYAHRRRGQDRGNTCNCAYLVWCSTSGKHTLANRTASVGP